MLRPDYDTLDHLFARAMPWLVPGVLVPTGLVSGAVIHGVQRVAFARAAARARGKMPAPCDEARRDGPGSMADLLPRLKLDAFDPLPLDGYTSTMVRGTVDIVPMFLDTVPSARGRFFGYPRAFHEALIPGDNGVPISATLGLHHAMLPRPTLVLVHGLLNSKNNDLVRVAALRAYYEWGFNVCAVDLRGFGRSAAFMSVPTAGGGLEARDLIEVVRYLKRFPNVTTVGLLGFSLGGGAVLNAAGLRGAEIESLLDGGVMAVCPPLDFEQAMNRLENPPEDIEYLFMYHLMSYLLDRMVESADLVRWARKRLAREGGDAEIHNLSDYMKKLVAWGYLGPRQNRGDYDPEQLYRLLVRLTSPGRALQRIKVPTFVLAAADDPLTRLDGEQRQLLDEAAASRSSFRYHVTSRGGHCGHALVDPDWFYRVIRIFFSYWARWPTEKAHPFR